MTLSLTIGEVTAGLPPDASQTIALLGYCSAGTANTVYELSSPGSAASALGDGPLTELFSAVSRASKRTHLAVPLTTTGGSIGSVTETPAGPGPTPTLTGTPHDSYARIALKVARAGAPGVAQFRVAVDGYTYGPIVDMPAKLGAQILGTVDLTTITLADLNATTLKPTADAGGAQTITFTTPSSVQDIIDQANAGSTNMTFSLVSGKYMLITSDTTGTSGTLSIDASSTADTILGISGTATGTNSTYAIPNTGVTVTFPATSDYVADTIYSFSTTAPAPATSAIASAVTALRNSGKIFGLIVLAYDGVDAAEARTFVDALVTEITTLRTYGIYCRGIVGVTPSASDASVLAAFATHTSNLVMVCARDVYVAGGGSTTGINGKFRRSASWYAAALAATYRFSSDIGNGSQVPLDDFSIQSPDLATLAGDDRTASTALRNSRFAVLMTRPSNNVQGPWFARGWSRASVGSKFRHFGLCRVIDRAAIVLLGWLSSLENNDEPLTANGKLRSLVAKSLNRAGEALLKTALLDTSPPHASGVSVVVDETEDISVTDNLTVTASVQAKGQFVTITATLNLVDKLITVEAA